MAEFPTTEQEEKLDELFAELSNHFREVDGLREAAKQTAVMDIIKVKLQDAKALIKEFEREARTDGISPKELARRKTDLVNELNKFIALRKKKAEQLQSRQELLSGAQLDGGLSSPVQPDAMSTQQIVAAGRKDVQDIDNRLNRAEKVVEDTIQIGVQLQNLQSRQSKWRKLWMILTILSSMSRRQGLSSGTYPGAS